MSCLFDGSVLLPTPTFSEHGGIDSLTLSLTHEVGKDVTVTLDYSGVAGRGVDYGAAVDDGGGGC